MAALFGTDMEVGVGTSVTIGTRMAIGNSVEEGIGILVGANGAVAARRVGTDGFNVGVVLVIDGSTSVTTVVVGTTSCPAQAISEIPATKPGQPPLRVKRTGPPLQWRMEFLLVPTVPAP